MTAGLVCLEGVELVTEYLEGVLPPARRQAVDEHLAVCPRCVAFVASFRETPRIFRSATAAVLPQSIADALRRSLRRHFR
jgi:anti-sigma factor RsiW